MSLVMSQMQSKRTTAETTSNGFQFRLAGHELLLIGRRRRGWSQQDVVLQIADLCDQRTSRRTYQRIESGEQEPPIWLALFAREQFDIPLEAWAASFAEPICSAVEQA